MAASSLAGYNHPGANESVNTDTVNITSSSKIDNFKKSIKNILESKVKRAI